MKRIRISHNTQYFYHEPVAFGPHRALLRPREGHDVHIARSLLDISPRAEVAWMRDIYGNSIANVTFREQAAVLRVYSEVDVDLYHDCPIEFLLSHAASSFPFHYDATEQVELIPYRLPSYPHDGPVVQDWLAGLYEPGHAVGTSELLLRLNSHIHRSLTYAERHIPGVQLPCETLARRSGSCRDYAVLMMEAARYWGFATRFVTGYVQLAEGQHGATHAWVEVYLPGAGWQGFDPTNNKLVGAEHVSVGVARGQDKAFPLSGTWEGPANAFDRMEVTVQVSTIHAP